MNHFVRFVFIQTIFLALLLFGLDHAALYAQAGVPNPQADAHRAKGVAFADADNYPAAITEYQSAYHLDKSAHPKDAEFDLDRIAICCGNSGQYQTAASDFRQAIEIAHKIHDDQGAAEISTHLATMNARAKSLTPANSDGTNAKTEPAPETVNTGTETNEDSAVSHRAEAEDFIAKHDYAHAIDEYQHAYDLDKAARLKDAAHDLDGIAVCYGNSGQYPVAVSYFRRAITIAQETNNEQEAAEMYEHLALMNARARGLLPSVPDTTSTETANDKELADACRAKAKDDVAKYDVYNAIDQYKRAYEFDKSARPKDAARDLDSIGTCLFNQTNGAARAVALEQPPPPTSEQPDETTSDPLPTVMRPGVLSKGEEPLIDQEFAKAKSYYQQALAIQQQIGDQQGETATRSDIASLDEAVAEWETADAKHQQQMADAKQPHPVTTPSVAKLPVQSSVPDPKAVAHRFSGKALIAKNDYSGAIAEYQQAYDLDKVIHLKDAARDLDDIGLCYFNVSKYQKALMSFHRADKSKDTSLTSMTSMLDWYDPLHKAVIAYQQALAIQKQIGDKAGEADTQRLIEMFKTILSASAKATEADQSSSQNPQASSSTPSDNSSDADSAPTPAMPITAAEHRANGDALCVKYDYPGAINEYQQAYDLDKTAHLTDAARDLDNIGVCYFHMPFFVQATTSFQQALAIQQRIGDTEGVAVTRKDEAALTMTAYQEQQDLADKRQQAADKAEAAQKPDLTKTLDMLDAFRGGIDDKTGQYSKEISDYQYELFVMRSMQNKTGEAHELDKIGDVYVKVGKYDQAQSNYQQALEIEKQIHDTEGEVETRNGIAALYRSQRLFPQAISAYQDALSLSKTAQDKPGEVMTFSGIGSIYLSQQQPSQAVAAYQQALAVEETFDDLPGSARQLFSHVPDEVATLTTIASIYHDLGQLAKALPYYQQTLPIQQQVGDKIGEVTALNNIFTTWKILNQPGLAIFYGKLAINAYQGIRAKISSVDKDSEQVYLKVHQGAYRNLADLLISQGRLSEAQQVLRMLKEREFYDFLNPDANAPAPTMNTALLTKRENHWTTAYDTAAKPLADLGAQEQPIRSKMNHTADEDAQLAQLQARVSDAASAFLNVQKQITSAFSGSPTAEDTPPEAAAAQDVQRTLAPGTVALYTIVSPDRLDLILITHDHQKAYQSAITADTLYRKVLALRQVLTDPATNPTGPAAELYRLVLGPVQSDLDAAGAKTILFSLDDALRYVPPAVLYDPQTKQYVAERYRTELITLAGSKPAPPASPSLSILGLGVSEAQDGEPALPGVARELQEIVHEPGDAGGLISGSRLLNGQFTQAALEDRLKKGYPLVHFASHFALHATQETSYLLLGDGSHLSIAHLAEDPNRFQGVELLTLSACQTAMEVRGGSGGREVEGIANLAQSLGAGSVLASLWPVSDAATPPLMTALYGYRQRHPSASLAEALQAAQLSLLHKPMPATGDTAKRKTESDSDAPDLKAEPPFVENPNAPYAHPFYWAPFVLIGNWR